MRYVLVMTAILMTSSAVNVSSAGAEERTETVDVLNEPVLNSTSIQRQSVVETAPADAKADTAEPDDPSAGGSTDAKVVMSTKKFYHQNMTSPFPRKVYFRIFAKNRNWVWPPAPEAFVSRPDGVRRAVRISCQKDEKVCLGGWYQSYQNIPKTYIGVGPNGNKSCTYCCTICDGNWVLWTF
jgi:uncharacterized Zn-finger protein